MAAHKKPGTNRGETQQFRERPHMEIEAVAQHRRTVFGAALSQSECRHENLTCSEIGFGPISRTGQWPLGAKPEAADLQPSFRSAPEAVIALSQISVGWDAG